jgi:hypothetical protein
MYGRIASFIFGFCHPTAGKWLLPLDHTIGADSELAQLVEGLTPVTLDKGECLTIKAVSAQVRPATLARELGEVGVEGVAPLARGVVKGAEGVEGDEFFVDLVFHNRD